MKSHVVQAALGLRVKSGRAIAVVVQGPADSPEVVRRDELLLADSATPMPWQPFHPVMDLPWKEALAAVRADAKQAEKAATQAVRKLQKAVRDLGLELRSAAIVAGSILDPGQIPNPHIRAHAAEGQFFREAAARAVEACGLPHRTFAQKTLYAVGAAKLGVSPEKLRSRLTALGARRVKPWGGDEKEAALAAWLALVESRNG